MKRSLLIVLALLISVFAFGGCKIDVNKIASQNNSKNNSFNDFYEKQAPESNTGLNDDKMSVSSTNSIASQEETISEPSFDTSAYVTVYVTGTAMASLTEDVKGEGKVIGSLQYGENLSIIKSVPGNSYEESVSFVYSESLGMFGYIKNMYITDLYEECCSGETYYISDSATPIYADRDGTSVIKTLSKNDKVTVLAKLSGTLWRVQTKSDLIGYVGSMLLSTEKIVKKNTSSSVSSTSSYSVTSSDKKNQSTNISSSVNSKSSRYTGAGAPPDSGYTVYYVDVDIEYLALRSDESSKPESVIDELYYNDQVYVISSDGSYWYVYAPSCGKYGFISGNSEFLRMEYSNDQVYYDD